MSTPIPSSQEPSPTSPTWQNLSDDQKLILEQLDLILWAENRIQRVDSRDFIIDAFPHTRAIYEDDAQIKIIEKSAQMAVTICCVVEVIHKVWNGLNWYYLFPTQRMLSKFVQPRFDKLINQNPKLQEIVKNIDNVSVKEIGKGVVYFSGLGSSTKEGGEYDVLSVPVDGVTFDERERMKPNRVKDALSRMKASPHKIQRRISTPKLPGYGIDEDYLETDMKCLNMKCPHCSTWNCLDDEQHFKVKDYAAWAMSRIEPGFLACEKCGKPLDVFKNEFVAQHPDRKETSGYHVSGLYSPFLDIKQTLKDYRELASTRETQTFWNDVLGFPYLDVKARLSKEMILKRCSTEPMATEGNDCFIGIDIGGSRKGIHVVIGKPDSNWDFDIMWLGVVHEPDPNDPDFVNIIAAEISKLCYAFRIKRGVVDCEPQHMSRAIANRLKKMWRCQYSDSQRDGFTWDEEKKIVKVNRTESLDNSHDILSKNRFNLRRRNDEVEEFAKHCEALVKDEEIDEDTGVKTYIWKKIAKYDDYRHAFNYMVLASGYDGRKKLTVAKGVVNITSDSLYRPRAQSGQGVKLEW